MKIKVPIIKGNPKKNQAIAVMDGGWKMRVSGKIPKQDCVIGFCIAGIKVSCGIETTGVSAGNSANSKLFLRFNGFDVLFEGEDSVVSAIFFLK